MNDAGNVGIGTVTLNAKLQVVGALTASSLNGEQPPVQYEINPSRNAGWNQIDIPSAVVQNYLADDEGGTIRIIMRLISTDEVRTLDEHIDIEQPGKSNNDTAGYHGYTRQEGGGDGGFVLINGGRTEVIPWPWDWIYIRNYSSPEVGPISAAYTDFTVSILLRPIYRPRSSSTTAERSSSPGRRDFPVL